MAFTTSEQELYDFAKASLPPWLFAISRTEEVMTAFVKIFARVRENYSESRARKLILQASAPWLALHGADRGMQQQDGESDAAFRARMRNAEDAVTRGALIAAAQAIIDAEGISGTVTGLDMKRDKAFFGDFTEQSGTGGTFTDEGAGLFSFESTVAMASPIELFARSGSQGNPRLVIASAASTGNDGTFEVTSISADKLVFTNGSGVAEVDATASWKVQKHDIDGNLRDGFAKAFLGRGYRMSGNLPLGFIIILPFGCTSGTRESVLEMAQDKKAHGVTALVECRANL